MIGPTSTTLLLDLLDPTNERAWNLFLERYRPMLIGYAKRRGLQDSDAQDLVQETLLAFVTAHRAGNYKREKGRFRDWLGGIAANKAAAVFRRLDKREQQPTDDSRTGLMNRVPDSTRDHEEIWEREWERFVMERCMRLVTREFDAQTVRAFESYALKSTPADEVAGSLGMSRNAVYIAKSRVLERMRAIRADLELSDAVRPAV